MDKTFALLILIMFFIFVGGQTDYNWKGMQPAGRVMSLCVMGVLLILIGLTIST